MNWLSDLRVACRSLGRRRSYAALVLLMLGLGVGANSAIFAVTDAVLLQSLPFHDPERLVAVFADGAARGQGRQMPTTAGDYLDWRDHEPAFAGLGALRSQSRRITTADVPVVPLTHEVSANFFDVLGARPVLGRVFRQGEDAPGRNDVVMLSYGTWQTVFGGDPAVVGRAIGLDGRPHTVVGVMGPDFFTPHTLALQAGLWVPRPWDSVRQDRTTRDVVVFGRLAPGRTRQSAHASLAALAARLAREYPATNERWTVSLVPLRDQTVGSFTHVAGTVLAAVGLVLLIACANVANLTLARGAQQAGDLAVRSALGASRRRILGPLLAETVLFALGGGALGIGVAWLGVPALVSLIPPSAGVPFLYRATLSPHVLAVTLAIALSCVLLAALAPARQAMKLDVVEVLQGVGRSASMMSTRRWRQVLVVAEVALAVVVVAAAVLMWRTLSGLEQVPTGFKAEGLVKFRTSLRGDTFRTPASRLVHFEELQRRLAKVPGVTRVSGVNVEPPTPAGLVSAVRLRLPGQTGDPASAPGAVRRLAMPDYFETMGIPVLSGRGISQDDRRDREPVTVISQTMAERSFAGVDPIGRTFEVDGAPPQPLRIVGVVGDVLTAGLDPAPQPTFYLPYAQNPHTSMTLVMRVDQGDPGTVLRQAEQIAWSLSPWTSVYSVERMDQYLAELHWRPRFATVLLGSFGALAIVLAVAGLYAVLACSVLERRAEIGLRMALGARSVDVLRLILTDALRVVIAGVIIGDLAALALTRAMRSLLYGVEAGDPVTLALVSLGVVAVSALACIGPVLTASHVDPQAALREPA